MTMLSNRPRPTHRLVTDILRSLVQDDIETASELLASEGADIEELCALLNKSKLSGYFHTLISNTALTGYFAAGQLAKLEAGYQRQVEKNKNSLKLLGDIQNQLGKASIPFLTMKGFYLAQHFFGDVRNRFMWDIDILVRPEDLEAAIVAVAGAGLQPTSDITIDLRNPFWRIHAVEVRGETGKLDIHHTIRNLPKITFDNDRLWNNSQEFTIGRERFATISDTDTLLMASVGIGTDLQTSHHNLRKIWDIYMMLRQLDATTDWDDYFATRNAEGSLKLVINVFSFCILLLGAERDFPRLGRAVSLYSHMILINSEQQAEEIFARGRQHIANRILFSRLLPAPALHYWLGWLLTAPARVWHYR